eukprot:115999-Pelagomonas_calceolata.AAC.1
MCMYARRVQVGANHFGILTRCWVRDVQRLVSIECQGLTGESRRKCVMNLSWQVSRPCQRGCKQVRYNWSKVRCTESPGTLHLLPLQLKAVVWGETAASGLGTKYHLGWLPAALASMSWDSYRVRQLPAVPL